MPLPILLIGVAALAGTAGIGLGFHGGRKMKRANDTLSEAQKRDATNRFHLKVTNRKACKSMDSLGNKEMEVLAGFREFSELFERIKNKPEFDDIKIGGVSIPRFDGEKLKTASVGAALLVSGLGGATLGTAGGFAASGATTAAVMALGTASTGTPIATLGGAAATKATLAALGGGSIATGGGGVALGTTLLGAATIGVGLLVGGIVFSITGSVLSNKAEKAWEQMLENEASIIRTCNYLDDLDKTATRYFDLVAKMHILYKKQIAKMRQAVDAHGEGKVEWATFTAEEKLIVENTVLVVSVLYNMCSVQLVKKSEQNDLNSINADEIHKAQTEAEETLKAMNNQ